MSQRSQTLLQVMSDLGYDAMNLGITDFTMGLDFLKEIRGKLRFPFIASNIAFSDGYKSLADKYLIKPVRGIKVGILGIVDPDLFNKVYGDRFKGSVELLPVQTALKPLVAELKNKEKVDLIVLLANHEFKATKELIQGVGGIDVAIEGGGSKIDKEWLAGPSGPAVATLAYNGDEIGVIDVTLGKGKSVTAIKTRTVPLEESVAEEPSLAAMMTDPSLEQ